MIDFHTIETLPMSCTDQSLTISVDAEQYKLVGVNTKKNLLDISACLETCDLYGLALMPATLDNLKAIQSLSNYQPDRLVITDGVEKVFGHGKKPKYTSTPGGREFQLGKDIKCKITTQRQSDQPGDYCLNIYYHGFCARDCKMGRNDVCACKRGKTSNEFTSNECSPTAVIGAHMVRVHTLCMPMMHHFQ